MFFPIQMIIMNMKIRTKDSAKINHQGKNPIGLSLLTLKMREKTLLEKTKKQRYNQESNLLKRSIT